MALCDRQQADHRERQRRREQPPADRREVLEPRPLRQEAAAVRRSGLEVALIEDLGDRRRGARALAAMFDEDDDDQLRRRRPARRRRTRRGCAAPRAAGWCPGRPRAPPPARCRSCRRSRRPGTCAARRGPRRGSTTRRRPRRIGPSTDGASGSRCGAGRRRRRGDQMRRHQLAAVGDRRRSSRAICSGVVEQGALADRDRDRLARVPGVPAHALAPRARRAPARSSPRRGRCRSARRDRRAARSGRSARSRASGPSS